MNKKVFALLVFVYFCMFTVVSNGYYLLTKEIYYLFIFIPVFLFLNIFAGIFAIRTKVMRFRLCNHGLILLCVFALSAAVTVFYHVYLAFITIPDNVWTLVVSIIISALTHVIIFWNGIISVYLTSYQMGIKKRVFVAIMGMFPFINLIMFWVIVATIFREVDIEIAKERLNRSRASQKVCATKYPILLVHGIFFRDNKFFNYWGRVPAELKRNGAKVFYGNHQSAASIKDSAIELSARINEIVEKTNCEKVNIIAHSKGGLDCRYAIAHLGMGDKIASLTTINTPHRGCVFADVLLKKIPKFIQRHIEKTYNRTLRRLGDKNPDFMAAVNNLTDAYCAEFNEQTPMPEGIVIKSVGSILKRPRAGKFPFGPISRFVRRYDGVNDGVVGENSFKWGDDYVLLKPVGRRGISHGDIIDLNRENIRGFDVREFYVGLVNELKEKGL